MIALTIIFFLSCYFNNIETLRSGKMVFSESSGEVPGVQTEYFDQILDHFDNTSTTYWKQLYYVNSQYWGGGNSPIFLLVGGESDAAPLMLQYSSMATWGQKYKALLITLEHRFYGKSHPTEDASDDNLKKYLSSQQALADLAYFIDQYNTANNFTENKWILFGGSYPGNLVAWARLKYPQFVYGGISSSGPLEAQVDFYDYNNVVRESLDYFYPGCSNEVTKAVKSIQRMLRSPNKIQNFYDKIRFCTYSKFDPNDKYDVATLIQSLTNPITGGVQNNKMLENNGIDHICRYMMNTSNPDPVDRLIDLYKSLNYSCAYAAYNDSIDSQKKSSWNSTSVKDNGRQWLFQTCNEFGYFQTSEYSNSLFSNTLPLEFSTKQCTDIFGPEFNPEQLSASVDASNSYYGGKNITVDRVVFIYGSIDPWWPLGVVENPTEESPYYFVTGISHCYDMLDAASDDPPSLTAARNGADQYLHKWLS